MCRHISSSRYQHQHQQATPIGLQYFPGFITPEERIELTQCSLNLLEKVHQFRKLSEAAAVKTTTSLSQQHNLSSDEYFERIEITDNSHEDDDKKIKRRAQYFDTYGDHGHELTYFMNNSNIPSFVTKKLISKLIEVKEIQDLADDTSTLSWMFTFNVYKSVDRKGVVPGFPYHVDSDFNGDVTVILTLLAPAFMELRPLSLSHTSPSIAIEEERRKKESADADAAQRGRRIELLPGSLLLLSGEARWQWQHRVLPGTALTAAAAAAAADDDDDDEGGGAVKRISLVLGCRDTTISRNRK